jgi:hypothetical protein
MARYALAQHVFICVNGDHLVILDLKEDRYWALPRAQTNGISARVGGWPVAASATAEPAEVLQSTDSGAASETEEALELLRERGILVDANGAGKDATPVAAIAPARELTSDTGISAGPPLGSWFTFVRACVFAKLALKVFPFERVIHRVRRRKGGSPAGNAGDLDRARKLVEAFTRFRVFAFTSKDECLFDSLALLEFLSRYGIYPDWVFGVQTRPFAAHCWVQQGDIVFNDTVEHVSGYTPIMVV